MKNSQERIQDIPEGGTNPKEGAQPTNRKKILKLHENEENWTEGGGARPKFYHTDLFR